jgi:hypothetical protein
MSRRFVFQISLSTAVLLSPAVLVAQHAGTAAVGHVQMAAPVHVGSISGPQAMHAPGHVSRPASIMRPPTTVAHTSVPHSTSRPSSYKASVHANRARSLTNDVYANPYSSNDYPAPGLGFDYVHYAAVHPNTGHNHDHFRGGAIFPAFGGGYYYPGTDYVESGATDQSSAEQNQNGTDVQPIQSAESEAQIEEAPISSPRTRPTPVPASSEYIFVRRDGSVFFAVAYSWINGDLQYITKDGFRKLVSGGTLDLDATTQFNEQRGVPFHSPA